MILRKGVMLLENCELGFGKNSAIVRCVQSHRDNTRGLEKSLGRLYVLPAPAVLSLNYLASVDF